MRLEEMKNMVIRKRERMMQDARSTTRLPLDQDAQCVVVRGNWRVISEIKNPSEKVQLCAVNTNSYALSRLLKNGVVPTDNVMKAALAKDGTLLYFLYKFNIPVSDEVIDVALTKTPGAIKYIKDPTELMIQRALTNPKIFLDQRFKYRDLVKQIYPGNELMQRKWLRYGEMNEIE